MSGPDDGFPGKTAKDTSPFERELLADFAAFIAQTEIGRAHPPDIDIENMDRAREIVIKSVLDLRQDLEKIQIFSQAIEYLLSILERTNFIQYLDSHDSKISPVRKKVINYLLGHDPSDEEELKYFIRLFGTLKLDEPSGIVVALRNLRRGLNYEISYIESLSRPQAVFYIRKRLRSLK